VVLNQKTHRNNFTFTGQQWAAHVAQVGKRRNALRLFIEKSLKRVTCKREDSIKIDVGERWMRLAENRVHFLSLILVVVILLFPRPQTELHETSVENYGTGERRNPNI
jgi:hypothetical protein